MRKEYKVWYNNKLATQPLLDAIEEIVVQQDVDAAWEAQIKIPVCIAEDGSWHGEKEKEYSQNSRVRIEARIGDGEWTPLIDGTIVRQQPDYNAMPGSSIVTLVVHDDIRLLNTDPPTEDFGNDSDEDVIKALFKIDSIPKPPEIDTFPPNPDTEAVNNLTGKRIQMLREMAERYKGFHAYVLPGDTAGTSKACFKKFTNETPRLPTMYLTGPERNISRFNLKLNTRKATKVEGAKLDIDDPSSITEVSSKHPKPASGESATAEKEVLSTTRLDPSQTGVVDLQAAADAAAEESGFTLSASGEILPQCYTGILRPYMRVSVRASNSRYSGDYVLQSVTHTLGRSEYTQSFSVLGNAVSAEKRFSASAPSPSAAVGLAFNAQVDIL